MIALDSTVQVVGDTTSLEVYLPETSAATDALRRLTEAMKRGEVSVEFQRPASRGLREQLSDVMRRAGYVRDAVYSDDEMESWKPEGAPGSGEGPVRRSSVYDLLD